MKIVISRNELASGISAVEKFVPSKTPISILTGIKFSAYDDFLCLSATNLDMGIEYKIKNESDKLSILEGGSIVIGSKILSEIVRRISENTVEFDIRENKAYISSGQFNMVLPCFDAMDFPEISRNNSSDGIRLRQSMFKDMIKRTIYARADDTTSRPQLTGALIDYKDNILNMVALDGFRIAWCCEQLNETEASDIREFKTIVPGDTLLEISRIFEDDEQAYFELYASKNSVEFLTEKFLITSRVLDGDFIDYKTVMQIKPKTTAIVPTDELRLAVERASVLAREGNTNNLVKFYIAENSIEVQVETELGRITDKVLCSTEGEEMLIAFNAGFFIDALKTIFSPKIKLHFSDETGPCIITALETDNHKNFILPVRLRGDNS
ncbi:DNA polymerase III subunit beta [Tepidanaerobacter acetatoxydans Re1]|uniref:Beta sliding clamp n=1 Tax=Tepidanaerobacter acetatoxydans (strain DSM 21804 / JCM 16047 / Re1) TaxID=1209989 RepID=F4LR74_TEPAE|nr:DNA polymerase III subunit beta [Tepidanaerobacter acetatoxydans]AEE90217.1 DNA polymerase III, beta subunit [Tepidanaerobacter acetatoxydans Re1]CCP24679.1 DNA polymerase III subunit beta [Tepidanaerobacter acetatoxydans Re1]